MAQHQGKRIKGLWNVPSRTSGQAPTPRWGHSTIQIVKPDNKPYLFVYGGWDGSEALGDCFYYDVQEQLWITPEIEGKRPQAHSGHSMCNIDVTKPYHLVLIGGDQNDLRELWMFDASIDSWKRQKTESTHNIYIQGDLMVNERFIQKIREEKASEVTLSDVKSPSSEEVFLGSHSVEVKDTGFGTPARTAIINDKYRVKVKMKFPDTRSRHTATFVPHLRKIFLFGGGSSVGGKNRVFDDLWTLDTEKFVWEKPKTVGRVDALWGHSATLVGKHIFIFGGCHNTKMMNDLNRLNTETFGWDKIKIDATVVPAPRAAHTSVRYDENLIILWGGDNNLFLDDLYIVNCETFICKKLSFAKPKSRCAHTSNVIGDVMYVLGGGRDARTRFKELYAVNLEYAIEKSGIHELVETRKKEIEKLRLQYSGNDLSMKKISKDIPPPRNISEEEDENEIEDKEEELEKKVKDILSSENDEKSKPPSPPPLPTTKKDEFELRSSTIVKKMQRTVSDGLKSRRTNREKESFIPLSGGVFVDKEYLKNNPPEMIVQNQKKKGKMNQNNVKRGKNDFKQLQKLHEEHLRQEEQKRRKFYPRNMNLDEEIKRGNLRTEIESTAGSRYVPRRRWESTAGEEDVPIAKWLASVGLKKYTRIFVLNEVSMKSLEYMSEEDLIQIGINKVGPRKIILNELEKLKQSSKSKINGSEMDVLKKEIGDLKFLMNGMRLQFSQIFDLLLKRDQNNNNFQMLSGLQMMNENQRVKYIPVYINNTPSTYQPINPINPPSIITVPSPNTYQPAPQSPTVGIHHVVQNSYQPQQQQQQQNYSVSSPRGNYTEFIPPAPPMDNHVNQYPSYNNTSINNNNSNNGIQQQNIQFPIQYNSEISQNIENRREWYPPPQNNDINNNNKNVRRNVNESL